MSNLLLILPFLLSMVYMMADFHDRWWWYISFCALQEMQKAYNLGVTEERKKYEQLNQSN